MKEAPPIQIGTPSELLIQQFHRSYEEIANLAETRIEPAEFYRAIVTHAQAGIKASAAAFWLGTAAGDLQCAHQIHLDAVFSDDAEPNGHRRLLQTYLQSPRLLVLPPKHEVNYQTGEEPVLDNPTDRYLWLAPVSIEKRAVGVIELVLQNAEPPAIQAARLQFLSGLAHQASIFLRNLRIWRADDDRKLWTRIHEFGRQIHGSLDLVKVAYAVANEGARLVGCDRLSVVSCGWRPKVEAVSGLEVVDQRSNQIRHLASLGKAVCAGNQRLEFYGVPDETLSPELRRLLDRYLDEQPGKLLVVEPLPNRSGRNETRLRFALVMECFDGKSDRNTLVARLQHVGEQSAAALANAAEVRSIPLRWLWQPLLRLKKNFRSQRGTALLWLLAVFVAACSAFFCLPYPLKLDASGKLLPKKRRYLYPAVEGQVVSFQQGLDTGVRVTRNQPLVQMYDSELELRVVRLQNDINRCEEEINALTTQMELASSETQRVQIAARRKQKEFERDRKQAELLALKRRTDADLSRPGHFWLRAPIDGIILTSAFRERWLNRFVKPTDPLLHIGDPHQGWEIETRIPHYHLGHILESFAGRDELDVDVLLRSAPTRLFKGKLHRKDLAGEAISEPGTEPFVLARIRIAGADIPFDDRIPDDLLLAGTDIRLRIDCGPRSLAYSWFHGFWEFVHEALFF